MPDFVCFYLHQKLISVTYVSMIYLEAFHVKYSSAAVKMEEAISRGEERRLVPGRELRNSVRSLL